MATYAIINLTNKKIYVGQTCNLKRRAKQHIKLLKNGKHYCKEMQKDYDNNNKFGFIILFTSSDPQKRDSLLCAEDFYIACFQRKKLELYNDKRDSKCMENFFMLATRVEKNARMICDFLS